jgi:diacylglycerol kinase family enzyme
MDLVSTYANGISELPKFSYSNEQPPLIVDVIVNPHAGFFKRPSTLAKLIQDLELKLADLRKGSPRRKVELSAVHYTEHPGHARLITESILDGESRTTSGLERLLIGCGGDGTSNEICTALVGAGGDVLDRLKLLRLPLGTGNDVADASTFAEAYDLILGTHQPVMTGALLITTAGGPPRYSFNVASVGLDAFIVNLTNRFKRVIPGDAYKVMVDIGSLFYEQRIHPQPMTIRIQGPRGGAQVLTVVPSMVIVGISGRRTYGGHMPVLPGPDNVCVVQSMGIIDKIKNKKLFFLGRHAEIPQVSFFTSSLVQIDYHGRIPMQLDGEVLNLEPSDFPLSLRVLEPKIRVLRS